MPSFVPIRAITYFITTVCCLQMLAQAPKTPQRPFPSVPATAPTAASPAAVPTPASAHQSAYVIPSVSSQPAVVTYNGSQLSITAKNSSLSQILREISRETKMKITGGVADEHVFGTYGPASPAVVLAALLDGTGSNMLLVQGPVGSSEAPIELILTPRHGGPSPPSPHAYDDDAANRGSNEPSNPDPRPLPPPSVPVTDPNPGAGAASNAPEPPPAATPTQDQSPNGVKTPQQIYDQLMRLRQQQPSTPSGDNTPH